MPDNNKRLSTEQYQGAPAGSRVLPKDYIDYSPDNKGNALALQDAVFGETTDPASIGGATAKLFSRLKGIHQNLEAQTGALQSSGTFQNKTLLSTFNGTPAPLDLVATIDLASSPGSEWVLVTYDDGGLGNSVSLGVSVSTDGSNWNDLYNTGLFSVQIYDANGSNNTGVTFNAFAAAPLWIKSPYRFIRFADLGSGATYTLNVYSAVSPPFAAGTDQVNLLNGINNSVQYQNDEDKLYTALIPLSSISAGDIIRRSSRSFFTQPNSPVFITWTNDTTGAISIPAPALTALVPHTVANRGQNVTRLVNSNVSTLQVKPTAALVQNIYVDNLQAGIIFLGVHAGLTAAPAAGSIPTESYRIPSNGSTSISLDRVYAGQVWLSFSSTAGAITLSANLKNVVARFN